MKAPWTRLLVVPVLDPLAHVFPCLRRIELHTLHYTLRCDLVQLAACGLLQTREPDLWSSPLCVLASENMIHVLESALR